MDRFKNCFNESPPFCLIDRNAPKMLCVWLRARPKDALLRDPNTDVSMLVYVCRHLARTARAEGMLSIMHWIEAIRLLLTEISSIDAPKWNWRTALGLLAPFKQLNDVAVLLMTHQAKYLLLDEDGQSAVSRAIEADNMEFVHECVRRGLGWSDVVLDR
jgi:hypothetical protein